MQIILGNKSIFKVLSYLLVALTIFLFSSAIEAGNKLHINDIDMYYELHGQGSPMILIAGFSCDHTFWSEILGELSKHHKVLVFDNRGIGQTSAPNTPYTIALMADDVMQLAKRLKIQNPIIVGQSMGSVIAQDIGKRYGKDINKLVLINTFAKLEKAPEIAFDLTGKLQEINVPLKDRVQSIAPWVFSSEFLAQPDQLSKLIKLAESNPYPQTVIGYRRQFEAIKKFDSHSWLKEIKVPTLVIAAREDIIAPLADAEEVVKGIGSEAKLKILPGGHASPIEQPQKVLKAMSEI